VPVQRKKEIRRRRVRHEKIAKLRQRYRTTKSEAEKVVILQKLAKMASGLSVERFAG
jgi:hypothetical protein